MLVFRALRGASLESSRHAVRGLALAARCSLPGTIDPPELREDFVERDSRYPQGFQVDGFGTDLREKPAHIRDDNWRGASQGRGSTIW